MGRRSRTEDITNQLKTFSQIGKAITSSLRIEDVLKGVIGELDRLLKPLSCSLMLVDEDTGRLHTVIALGERAHSSTHRFAEQALAEARAVVASSGHNTEQIACVPLIAKRRCLGVIEAITCADGGFKKLELMLLETVADYTAIAIENARLFKRVEELTITDDLTGVYNSRYMHRYMDYEAARSVRYGTVLSMIFMDIDCFKQINDRYGHLCGSRLLAEFASLIASNTRSVDVVCRYGGDEFVILMPETPKDKALMVAEKLRKIIKQKEFLCDEGIGCRLTVSMGVASMPEDASTKVELINLADKAMYRVKNSSRDGIASS